MIFGMLPLAMALGEESEQRAPMGRAVIGGLITSTLLTLFVVPVVYTLLDDLVNRVFRRGGAADRMRDEAARLLDGAAPLSFVLPLMLPILADFFRGLIPGASGLPFCDPTASASGLPARPHLLQGRSAPAVPADAQE